jgi:STE24 endopeptidase
MITRVTLALALLLALASPAASPSATPAPHPPPAARRFVVHVTPEMIRHSRLQDVLYFVDFLYGAGVLLLVLATGISARLRDLAARLVKWRFVVAMIYFVLLSLVTTALEFPLSFYQGFVVPHQFDLTNQSFASWVADFAKEIAVDVVIGAPIAALALAIIRRFRRWWVVLWLGSIPLIILGVVITPLIIDPLFNKFEPLKDQVLRRDLLTEAARAGIEGSRVYQVNKSKQTKTMNAYVTGLGPSKRIVLWDTLLAKLDHDEILAVMGHEMGHYVLHHLWKGIAFGVVVSFFGFFVAQKIYERGLGRWGITDRADPAALPWLLLVASVLGFLLSPITSGFSRHIEHQADKFGLELTHLNEATASAFVKFAEDSKQDPNPPRFIEWWRYSHPAAQRRIDFALRYRPWESGRPGRSRRASTPGD